MEKEKHPIINNCLGTALGTLLVTVILALIPIVRNFFVMIFQKIIEFLTASSKFPNYIILLLSVLSVSLIIIVFIRILNIRKKKSSNVQTYIQDNFLGMKWRWNHIENNFPSSDLWCFCPKCDCRLIHENIFDKYVGYQVGIVFHCTHCGFKSDQFQGDKDDIKKRIGREVERKINSNDVLKKPINS